MKKKQQNFRGPRSFWTTQSDFEGFWADVRRILHNYVTFMFLWVAKDKESIESSCFEKHIEHTVHACEQIRSWSSNILLDYNFYTWTVKYFKQQSILAILKNWR